MFRNIVLIFSVVMLAGCVSTTTLKLDREKSASLRGKSLIVSTSDRPDFAAMTAGKAMFAMVGALAMISAGNEIIRNNDVEDPAVYIGTELAKKLAGLREMNPVEAPVPSKDESIEFLAKAHASHDYALDVRTINWSFGYFPTDWDNYRVMYSAKVRLIDLQNKQVVAEAFCARVPEQTPSSPTYDQLLNNSAAGLKAELRVAAEHCVQELGEKLL